MAITKPQLIQINRSLNNYEHLQVLYGLAKEDLSVCDSIIDYYKRITETQSSAMLLSEAKYQKAEQFNTSLQQQIKKQSKKSRNITIGVGVGSTLLGLLLGVLLSK